MARIKGKISQEILHKLSVSQVFVISGQNRFWPEIYRRLLEGKNTIFPERNVRDAFYYLKRKGLIAGEKRDNQICISLTLRGEKEAEQSRVNRLEIRRPKQWDKKWRLVVFDIPAKLRQSREALRFRVKQLGLHCLQKNVWVTPFPCEKEVKFLREFYELDKKSLRLIETIHLEEDKLLREIFQLS